MENKEIKAILEKYWAGESSLQEEEILRKAVHDPNASEKLKSLRMLFTTPVAGEQLSATAEDKMDAFLKGIQTSASTNKMSLNSNHVAKVKPLHEGKVKQLPKRNWLKIAVVALLLIGIGGVWTNRVAEQERMAALETYEQTKEALAMMGLHFKTGEETTLNTIINASDKLDILN